MKRILNNTGRLSYFIRGMVFAVLMMCLLSSCCVTGYCQVNTADIRQVDEGTNNDNIKN